MSAGGGKLVATDKPTIGSEPFLDAIVVEGSQSDGRFADPPCTDQSDGSEMFREINELLDQILASETGPRWRWRWLSRYARYEYETSGPSVVGITDRFLPSAPSWLSTIVRWLPERRIWVFVTSR